MYEEVMEAPTEKYLKETPSTMAIRTVSEKTKEEILKRDPDLAIHWQNRHLRLFMQRTSSPDFPPPPLPPILERILRFTAIVERTEYAKSEKYEDRFVSQQS